MSGSPQERAADHIKKSSEDCGWGGGGKLESKLFADRMFQWAKLLLLPSSGRFVLEGTLIVGIPPHLRRNPPGNNRVPLMNVHQEAISLKI